MTENNKIWIVDDDKSIRWVLEKALAADDMQVVSFDGPGKLLSRLGRKNRMSLFQISVCRTWMALH